MLGCWRHVHLGLYTRLSTPLYAIANSPAWSTCSALRHPTRQGLHHYYSSAEALPQRRHPADASRIEGSYPLTQDTSTYRHRQSVLGRNLALHSETEGKFQIKAFAADRISSKLSISHGLRRVSSAVQCESESTFEICPGS